MMCIWLVYDSVGQRSHRSIPGDYDDVYASRVEVIDNVGQRSTPLGVNNMNMVRSEVIDKIGQRSPRSLQSKVDEIRVFRGEIIDNVGQRSPHTETNPRIPEIGVGSNSINFSQSVTQILASLGRDGYFIPGKG